MISYRVKVTGVEPVIKELQGFRLDRLAGVVDGVLDLIAADAAEYPPELPGQRYIRTGDLGRGWTNGQTLFPHKDATQLEAVRTNSVDYAPYVMGDTDQAAVHSGRWQTDQQIMDAWESRVAQLIEDALVKVLP